MADAGHPRQPPTHRYPRGDEVRLQHHHPQQQQQQDTADCPETEEGYPTVSSLSPKTKLRRTGLLLLGVVVGILRITRIRILGLPVSFMVAGKVPMECLIWMAMLLEMAWAEPWGRLLDVITMKGMDIGVHHEG